VDLHLMCLVVADVHSHPYHVFPNIKGFIYFPQYVTSVSFRHTLHIFHYIFRVRQYQWTECKITQVKYNIHQWFFGFFFQLSERKFTDDCLTDERRRMTDQALSSTVEFAMPKSVYSKFVWSHVLYLVLFNVIYSSYLKFRCVEMLGFSK
jgi:hypothetical protein